MVGRSYSSRLPKSVQSAADRLADLLWEEEKADTGERGRNRRYGWGVVDELHLTDEEWADPVIWFYYKASEDSGHAIASIRASRVREALLLARESYSVRRGIERAGGKWLV